MGLRQSPRPSLGWRLALVAAALDSAAAGAWAALRPGDLLHLLQCPPSADRLLLCRALGLLFLAHAPLLLLAAFRAGGAGLALAPLLGRLLTAGLWLWLLAAGGMAAPTEPDLHGGADQLWPWLTEPGGAAGLRTVLIVLLIHEAVWPPLLAAFLATRRKAPPAVTAGGSPAPAPPATPPTPPA